MVDIPNDDRILFASMVSALTEATQTMAKVAAQASEQHAWIKGHEALCDMREKTTQRSLDAMAAAVEKLAETVERNASIASEDRRQLAHNIAQEQKARAAEREAARAELMAKEEKTRLERRSWLRWIVGTIIAVTAAATGVLMLTRGVP